MLWNTLGTQGLVYNQVNFVQDQHIVPSHNLQVTCLCNCHYISGSGETLCYLWNLAYCVQIQWEIIVTAEYLLYVRQLLDASYIASLILITLHSRSYSSLHWRLRKLPPTTLLWPGLVVEDLPPFLPYIHRSPSGAKGNQSAFWWEVNDCLLLSFPLEWMKWSGGMLRSGGMVLFFFTIERCLDFL
jgi:hypothetical protein